MTTDPVWLINTGPARFWSTKTYILGTNLSLNYNFHNSDPYNVLTNSVKTNLYTWYIGLLKLVGKMVDTHYTILPHLYSSFTDIFDICLDYWSIPHKTLMKDLDKFRRAKCWWRGKRHKREDHNPAYHKGTVQGCKLSMFLNNNTVLSIWPLVNFQR